MYKRLLVLVLLLYTLPVIAQNKAAIKGKVIDSTNHKPVEFVTVAVLTIKDTTLTLQSYTITDKTGAFSLHNLPAGIPLKIFISTVAYRPFRKIVTINKGQELDLGDIALNGKQLNEVTITVDRPPIVIRKDTIEFNVEAFKTRPNAVAEDLLKKLPGVEVDMAGNILIKGHDVSKILVDGHEFFKNDYRIATKNIDVDLLDKVQVYDDRENDPNHLIPESKVDKIINLKFKKVLKKSSFGKIYGGSGTRHRYTAGGLYNMFRDTLQVSILGVANNLNNTGFSYADLSQSGGFNRGGGDTFLRGGIGLTDFSGINAFNQQSGFMGFTGFGGGNGLQKAASGGVNINTDYGKKLKINFSYFYNHVRSEENSTNTSQRFLGDTVFYSAGRNLRLQLEDRHNISTSVKWEPNDKNQLNFSTSFTYNKSRSSSLGDGSANSNFTPVITRSNSENSSDMQNIQFNQSMSYNHRFKKKDESLNLSYNLATSPRNGSSLSIDSVRSYTAGLASYFLNRSDNTKTRQTDLDLNLSYRYPFSKKLSAKIDVSSVYTNQVNNTITYDFDTATGFYDKFLLDLTSTLTRNWYTQNITPGLTYNFKDNIRLEVSLTNRLHQVNNNFGRGLPNLNQHYYYLLPSVNFTVGDYSANYNVSYTIPEIVDMTPYTITSNPQYSVTGNPDLKPARRDNFKMEYRNSFSEGIDLNAEAGGYIEQNGVVRHQTIDGVGSTTSKPINTNGGYAISSAIGITKSFKKFNDFQLSSATKFAAAKTRSYFELNQESGYQSNNSYSLSQQFSINWSDILSVEQSYTINKALTQYTGITNNDINYITHILSTHLILTWPKVVNIESTYAYVYNPRVSAAFSKSSNLFNLSVAHSFLKKDRGEIKLSCYDILNQNTSLYHYVTTNAVYDWQSQVLSRYFLLTLQFKFNKTITK